LPQLFICGAVQLLLAVPFLYTNPLNYLLGAFNLGRVFLFQWTLNFRYMGPIRASVADP
jgi:alpha-1,3-mannosyltransferase